MAERFQRANLTDAAYLDSLRIATIAYTRYKWSRIVGQEERNNVDVRLVTTETNENIATLYRMMREYGFRDRNQEQPRDTKRMRLTIIFSSIPSKNDVS